MGTLFFRLAVVEAPKASIRLAVPQEIKTAVRIKRNNFFIGKI